MYEKEGQKNDRNGERKKMSGNFCKRVLLAICQGGIQLHVKTP